MTLRPFRSASGVVIIVVTFLTSPASAATGSGSALPQLSGEIIGLDGAPMALVTAGRFIFGDGSYNNPERRIYLDSFYMDKFEVTLARYAKFLRATSREYPFTLTTTDLSLHGDRPVVNVDWHDAQAYCHWAGKYLPDEAQWEKAARGADGRAYPWGNDSPSRSLASFDWDGKRSWQGYDTLSLVGSYEKGKSPYGIYDMAGNVWEWVAEWTANPANKENPKQNLRKVVKGGSWANDESSLPSGYWYKTFHSVRANSIGFRCAQG